MTTAPSGLSGRTKLPSEGERRFVTLVFADLSGFTAMSKALEPEEVRDAANLCFEHLNTAIIKQGGTIYKYEGDLVIAIFGLPEMHEDDPERAVRAALEMMDYLPQINRALSAKLRIKGALGLHIGINSGTVYVGEVGSADKHEYSVMGDVVNFASRLKDVSKYGEIIVAESTYRLTRYLFDYAPVTELTIKGLEGRIRAYKPSGIKEKPEPKRGIQGLYSPMVGRDREFDAVRAVMSDVCHGQERVVFITGEAGVGKSRLALEMLHDLAGRGSPVTILEGRCLSYGRGLFYHPFLHILKNLFGIKDQDSSTKIKEQLQRQGPLVMGPEYAQILPYIGYLFSIRFEGELDEKIKYLDAKSLKIQIHLSMRQLVTLLARRQPLVLIIEDYHWIDSGSLELLEFIVDLPGPLPVAFVCLSRIEKGVECHKAKERLSKKLGVKFSEIVLKPLEYEASSQLVYNLLQIPGITEGFKDRILAKAEGSPFFLEEIVRSLIDAEVLVFTDGVWRLTTDIAAIRIPDTVQAVIAARTERLEPEVKDVLQRASVVGRTFDIEVLEPICNIDRLILSLHLGTLEAFEFIGEDRIDSKFRYQFRHPVVHEVTYNSLLKKRRMELHRLVGEIIEQLYPDRLAEFAEVLAHQYSNSDNLDKAVHWLKQAGHKARERFANDEAVQHFKRLIELVRDDPDTRSEDLAGAYEALGDVFDHKGNYRESIDCYSLMRSVTKSNVVQARATRKIALAYEDLDRADNALKMLDEAERLVPGNSREETLERSEIRLFRCSFYRTKGETERAITECEKELKVLEELDIDATEKKRIFARSYNVIGLSYWVRGDYSKAAEYFEKTFDLYLELDYKRGLCIALNNLGLVHMDRGEYDKAISLFEKDARISEEIGHKRGVATAYNNMGDIYYYRGDYRTAIELYMKDYKITEEVGHKLGVGVAAGYMSRVYRELGEYLKALEYLQLYLRASTEIGDKMQIGNAHCFLGETYFDMGEVAKAEEHLLHGESILLDIGNKDSLLSVYIVRAELELVKGPHVKQALEYAERAVKLAADLGSHSGQAACSLTFGKIYTAAGQYREATESLDKAIDLFTKIGRPKLLADSYTEYGRMLKRSGAGRDQVEEYVGKARRLYQDLKLGHKLKELDKLDA